MRSVMSSMWPMSMVAEVCMPSLWASDMTSSQASPVHLPGPMRAADAVGEDFTPPAGDGGQARGLEAAEDFAHGQVEEAGEFDEFRRGEGVDVDGGEFFADAAEEILVIVIGRSGFMPPCMRICVPPMETSSAIFL